MSLSLLSSLGFAQDGSPSSGESLIANFLPIILIIAVFYFLLLRPQQKRAKEHRNMINDLSEGTKIITGGGIFGIIKEAKSGEKFIIVEIAHNIKIKIKRDTIVEVIADDTKLADMHLNAKHTASSHQKDKATDKTPSRSNNKQPSSDKASRKNESKNLDKK